MKARLANLFRRWHPHPAAITRRIESERARKARAKRDAADRVRYLTNARQLFGESVG